ncbi:hypothetical protein MAXJ12_19538 [Mesorhizobium alhagi CCNWXJ12-2]|uniref:Uncharacterized protein n=1 Tax=Mesorhizobium alhagi CCNWXJ12-2 TaxID=1107882 RepID=H0HUP4_9HYPH|nr:hypothetical protein MAXJ12_19538 [Mesorhizobium alhagi CCNWXJ12-2]
MRRIASFNALAQQGLAQPTGFEKRTVLLKKGVSAHLARSISDLLDLT